MTDGSVVAWPSYTKANRRQDKREIKFTVKAQVLKRKDGEEADTKDEL
jgi:hypothetical protein